MDKVLFYKSRAEAMVLKVTTQERIGEFLEMLSRFPQMGLENILLLIGQMPTATVVCGKYAWEKYGATVREGMKPVALLGIVEDVTEYEDEDEEAEDEDELALNFGIVGVFDISQVTTFAVTPNFQTADTLKIPVEQLLREKYHVSVVDDVSGENIRTKISKSLYRDNEKTLYLKRGLTNEQIEAEVVKTYVKIALLERGVPDFIDEMEHYTMITLCKHFGLSCADSTVRPTELFSASFEEKQMFLRALADNFFSIVCELTGKEMLSFQETALCNIFFSSPDVSDVLANIGGAVEMPGSEAMGAITKAFQSRVMTFDEPTYAEIKRKRDWQILYTFPPTVLNEQS